MSITATRLGEAPIIRPDMDDRMGGNINGPSIIRVPDWAQGGFGRYRLYFADHKGSYIRLAYADRVTGPWRIHPPGALDLGDSHFAQHDRQPGTASDAALAAEGYLDYAHVASPDVHVDHDGRRFLMYVHGMLEDGDQQTRLAVSDDGIRFSTLPPLLGPPYFRAFRRNGYVYAIAYGGHLWRAPDWHVPFERGPNLIALSVRDGVGTGFRHGEVHVVGDWLHLFFTRMGDTPERILHTTVAMTPDWTAWRPGEITEILRPALPWEGADLPLAASRIGAAETREQALRDPCVFCDDGRTYLLYCGAGESGIGLCELTGL